MSVLVPVICEDIEIEVEFFDDGDFEVHGYDIEEAETLEEMGYKTPGCLALIRTLSQRTLRFLFRRAPLEPYELMIPYLLDCLQRASDETEFDEFIPWMDQVVESIRALGTEGKWIPWEDEGYKRAISEYKKFKEWWDLEYEKYQFGEREGPDGNYMAYMNDMVKAHLRWILGMAIDQEPTRVWDEGGMGFPKLYHFVDAMAKANSYFRMWKIEPELKSDLPHERFFPEERAWQIGRYVEYLEG